MNGAAGAVGSDGCCRELPGGWTPAMPLEAETRHRACSQGCMRAQPTLSGPVPNRAALGNSWRQVGSYRSSQLASEQLVQLTRQCLCAASLPAVEVVPPGAVGDVPVVLQKGHQVPHLAGGSLSHPADQQPLQDPVRVPVVELPAVKGRQLTKG